MGCVASAVAVKEKSKAKVQPVPSPKMLRGDLISRDEAKQRRIKTVAEHHAKANKLAQTVAYNTMAEKEMMSTASTERSYRSGRGFLISATASSLADNSASEQGSSSTVSDGANPLRPELQAALPRNRTDAANSTSTRLPYAVPEEESLHQLQDSDDVKGQEVRLQDDIVKGQRTVQERSPDEIDKSREERTQESDNEVGISNLDTRTDVNVNEQEVEGQEAGLERKVSRIDTDEEPQVKKPARVQFKDEIEATPEAKQEDIKGNERTKPTDNGAVATAEFQPAS